MAHKLKNWNVQRKNRFCVEECHDYGYEAAAFTFALALKGSVRCQGQQEWHRKPLRIWNRSLYLRQIVVEEIDLSGSVISYDGLDNLVRLEALQHLDLSRCPNIDDWSLNRLHVFADTLQELSLAGCPQITEKGLACLHQLQNLKRLDLSDLPAVPNKGLIRILLEEMLPECEIVGMDSGDELDWHVGSDAHQSEIEEPQGVVCNRKTDKVSI
ncbi:distal membrane-arm assembly complex protein 2 isoform X2 [Elgaria multicarinata webbii]